MTLRKKLKRRSKTSFNSMDNVLTIIKQLNAIQESSDAILEAEKVLSISTHTQESKIESKPITELLKPEVREFATLADRITRKIEKRKKIIQ